MLAARFNRDGHELIDHHTYTIASDGDMQEGVASEASSLAGHLGLGRLIVFYDDNHIQLAGPTDDGASARTSARATRPTAGTSRTWARTSSQDEPRRGDRRAPSADDRQPSLIILRTHIGYGSPNKQDTQSAHGSPLGEDEVRADQGGLRLGPRRPLPRARRGARALPPSRGRARARRPRPSGTGALEAYRAEPPGAWAELSAGDGRRAAGRLGRRPAALRPRRRPDRHPQGLRSR